MIVEGIASAYEDQGVVLAAADGQEVLARRLAGHQRRPSLRVGAHHQLQVHLAQPGLFGGAGGGPVERVRLERQLDFPRRSRSVRGLERPVLSVIVVVGGRNGDGVVAGHDVVHRDVAVLIGPVGQVLALLDE